MGYWVIVCFDWIDVVKKFGIFRMRFRWFDVLLIVFGLFLAYQIIRYLLGGSWAIYALTMGLQFIIIGILWKLSLKIEGHINWHRIRDGER